MLHAAGLVRPVAQLMRVVVVVSAMKGVTDRLLWIAQALGEGNSQQARSEAEAVLHLHLGILRDLALDSDDHDRVARELNSLGCDLLHEVSPRKQKLFPPAAAEFFDRLASFGERFSARLFAAALERSGVAAVPVSSSEFVLTCDTFQDAKPHLEQTRQRGRAVLLPLLAEALVPVVTRFIGATADRGIATLGAHSSELPDASVAPVADAVELRI